MGAFLFTILSKYGLKAGALLAIILAILIVGFRIGLRWDATKIVAAESRASEFKAAAEKAEGNYKQLQREVAQAMVAARDRAVELEKVNEEARSVARKSAEDGIRAVASSADSLRKQLAEVRRSVAVSEMSTSQPPCGSNDASPNIELAERVRAIGDRLERVGERIVEAAKAEARLTVLQTQVATHDAEVMK